jgi:hypothetical protein
VAKFIIIPQRFAFRSLILNPEVASARFIALKRIKTHQFGKFEKIGNAAGMFQRLIKLLTIPQDIDVFPELLA